MSLITKQIDELRAYAANRKGELEKLINDAADTIEELAAKLQAAQMDKWIPIKKRMPEVDEDGYSDKILLSFSNSTLPVIGEYRTHDIKGADFYVGDMEETFSEYGLKVNAWRQLPKPYQKESEEWE